MKIGLPIGVQDFLPGECYNKLQLEEKLSKLFISYGYNRVEPPTLEYYELFDSILPLNKLNSMFKMQDFDGSLLVLRPDTTLQICRMAATKLDTSYINRLYYVANSFEYLSKSTSSARTREFAQVGVEMLGESGNWGDVEMLTLAIQGLLNVGLDDFLIEIGQVDFFNGLIEESGISESDFSELKDLINKKDMLGVELFLHQKNFSNDFITNILTLPTLFGDFSILDNAEKLSNNPKCLKAIANLKFIIEKLSKMGYDKYISIDLGIVSGNYYSGLVMRGVSKNLGLSILDGGRYDKLCGAFGKPSESVGFAIGVKRLLMALDNQNKLEQIKPNDYCYIVKNCDVAYEFKIIDGFRNGGKSVVKCFTADKKSVKSFCKKLKIEKLLVLQNNTYTDILAEEF